MHPGMRISGPGPGLLHGAGRIRRTTSVLACLLLLLPFSASAQDAELSGSTGLQTEESGAAEQPRRVKRLGDSGTGQEWQFGVAVPDAGANLDQLTAIPDEAQREQLRALLSQLSVNPGDARLLAEIDVLLASLLDQAAAAAAEDRVDDARALLAVVDAVNPQHPRLADARRELAEVDILTRLLEQGRAALEAGRVDQPEDDSAWSYYRQALDADPTSPLAADGLADVQRALIARARQLADGGEFDSAERVLEDASFVREDPAAIAAARQEIEEVKQGFAELLESRAVQAMDAGNFDGAERILIDLVALGGQGERVNQLRRRMDEARNYGGFQPGQVIRDHFLGSGTWAPETVVILAGSFMMGSPPSEEGRSENEGPVHRVTFRRGFAIGQREVTVGQFRTFVKQTGYRTDADRVRNSLVYDQFSGRLTEKKAVNWQHDYEGNLAEPDQPVVHVSWNDANAYTEWLARGTGKSYRLPSEAEFEYALRAGTSTRYWWGDGSPSRLVENLTGDGDSSRTRRRWSVAFKNYSDRYWGIAPVATFEPNPFGLYDMGGNVGEWVRDCWHDTYIRAPVDGSAWINPGCGQRVIRGGYWASSPDQTRSAYRLFAKPDFHDARIGFRVARDL